MLEFLRKLQSQPPHVRKAIFWLVLVVIAAALFFGWFKTAQQRFASFRETSFIENLQPPKVQFPQIEVPQIYPSGEATRDIPSDTDNQPGGVTNQDVSRVCFRERCFMVEIADTLEERSRGLMGRRYLEAQDGMLFVFDVAAPHQFWMKDTEIPLDIIWLNRAKEVIFIANNAQPCREEICPAFIPATDALYVLEVNAGTAELLGLQLGNTMEIFQPLVNN